MKEAAVEIPSQPWISIFPSYSRAYINKGEWELNILDYLNNKSVSPPKMLFNILILIIIHIYGFILKVIGPLCVLLGTHIENMGNTKLQQNLYIERSIELSN